MRIKAWFMLASAMLLVVPVAYAGAGGVCVPTAGATQNCTISEGVEFDNFNPEPTVTVASLYAPDLQVGYVPIWEFGSTPALHIKSDYLVFPDSGNGYAGVMTLYSADALGNFPPNFSLSGLSQIQVYDLNQNPIWGVVEAPDIPGPYGNGIPVNFGIWEGVAGAGPYFDTFSVISDPSPEPGTLLLIGSGIMLAVRKLRK